MGEKSEVMKYQARDWNTNEVITEAMDQKQLQEDMRFMFPEHKMWSMTIVYQCRGCGKHEDECQTPIHERRDYYGIFTGHYCEDCYEDNYPYRKDAYDPYNDYGTR